MFYEDTTDWSDSVTELTAHTILYSDLGTYLRIYVCIPMMNTMLDSARRMGHSP